MYYRHGTRDSSLQIRDNKENKERIYKLYGMNWLWRNEFQFLKLPCSPQRGPQLEYGSKCNFMSKTMRSKNQKIHLKKRELESNFSITITYFILRTYFWRSNKVVFYWILDIQQHHNQQQEHLFAAKGLKSKFIFSLIFHLTA